MSNLDAQMILIGGNVYAAVGLAVAAVGLGICLVFYVRSSGGAQAARVVRVAKRATLTQPRSVPVRNGDDEGSHPSLEKLARPFASVIARVKSRLLETRAIDPSSAHGPIVAEATHSSLGYARLAFCVLGVSISFGVHMGYQAQFLSGSSALFASLGGLAGFLVPDYWMRYCNQMRAKALRRALPDGMDLLVICAEAGLSLDAALQRVAQEIRPSHRALSEELGLTATELALLPDRRQALVNLAKRAQLSEVRSIVTTLTQTEKYGTPVAQSLRLLASEMRERQLLKAEERAARLPAILTVPMILFILPALFVVIIGPAMIEVYDQLIRGSG